MQPRIVKPNQESLAAAFGQRLSESLTTAGLSIGQVAKKLKAERGLVQRWAEGRLLPAELEDYVDLGELLHVDPRYLANGEISEAAQTDAAAVRAAFVGKRVRPEDVESIVRMIQRLPVHERVCGECRYCGCTDEMGCGDCHWVDDACTICSTCLEPRG